MEILQQHITMAVDLTGILDLKEQNLSNKGLGHLINTYTFKPRRRLSTGSHMISIYIVTVAVFDAESSVIEFQESPGIK
jgi:hypothetical protein